MGSNYPSQGKDFDLNRTQQVVETFMGNGASVHGNFPGLMGYLGNGQILTVTTHATPGTEVSVAHTLVDAAGVARTPSYYIVLTQDKAGSLYPGTTAWSSSAITLASDIASVTAKVYVV